MMDTRPFGSWLRALSGLLAAAAVVTLSACGGGSGAPNNPYVDGGLIKPLVILPNTAVDVYPGVPTVLTISGGKSPYTAASSNSAIVPVATNVSGNTIVILAGNVASTTADAGLPVTVTVRDANGSIAVATLAVHPSTLFSGITIKPNSADCGESAICSGQNGVASVTVQAPGGSAIGGRLVRFDVVSGPFGIVSTAAGSPIVSSFTVAADSLGNASVLIKANVNAPTQQAQLRATDLATGQEVTGSFIIQQVIDGTKVLGVVPDTATVTSFYNDACSSGVVVEYRIYGGTPPYRISSSFPAGALLLINVVNESGGFFRAQTNGSCVDPLTFSIVDAAGLQTTAKLQNLLGNVDPPAPPPTSLKISPSPVTCNNAGAGASSFVVTGGTPTYWAVVKSFTGPAAPTIAPQTNVKLGELVTISGLAAGRSYTFTVGDTGGQTTDFSFTCP